MDKERDLKWEREIEGTQSKKKKREIERRRKKRIKLRVWVTLYEREERKDTKRKGEEERMYTEK